MIITRLNGGLGNQMFQYAAGRRLAHINNTELKLDLNGFYNIPKINTERKYELNVLNIKENIAGETEINLLKPKFETKFYYLNMAFLKVISTLKLKKSYIRENEINFNSTIINLPDNVYLEGYWQSEKYFSDIREILIDEFTLRDKPDDENLKSIREIQRTNSVCIHVRRGDYIENIITNKFHGFCGLDYYLKSIELIKSRVQNPYFFIFSDDPQWTKENLKLKFPAQFMTHNLDKKNHEDLRLMMSCKHHIIANSSFSWWGAWLNRNPDKFVIAPKKWFNMPVEKMIDIVPESWIKI